MLSKLRALRLFRVIVVFAVIAGIASIPKLASACTVVTGQQTCSTNYSIGQSYFGSGGQLGTTGHGCSTNYCAVGSVGDLADGNATNGGTGNQVQSGSYGTIARNPSLALTVNDSNCTDYQSGGTSINLGYLSFSSATTLNINFSVESYLTSGYIIQTHGNPPTNTFGHQLTPITTVGGANSSAGTEQFGINLMHNTSPSSFGANPAAPTNGINSNGVAAANYNTANKFYYNNGDTIADSTQSSGTTCFVMSYLFNASTSTSDGQYTFNQTVIATSTF